MVSAVVDLVAEANEGWARSAAVETQERAWGMPRRAPILGTNGLSSGIPMTIDYTPLVTLPSPLTINTCSKISCPCPGTEREGSALW